MNTQMLLIQEQSYFGSQLVIRYSEVPQAMANLRGRLEASNVATCAD